MKSLGACSKNYRTPWFFETLAAFKSLGLSSAAPPTVPAVSLAVASAYESGLIEALSLDGKQVVWTGRHSGLYKLVAGSSLLLTRSTRQLRQWPVHPGAANSVFRC